MTTTKKGTYLEGYNAGLKDQLDARNKAIAEADALRTRLAACEAVLRRSVIPDTLEQMVKQAITDRAALLAENAHLKSVNEKGLAELSIVAARLAACEKALVIARDAIRHPRDDDANAMNGWKGQVEASALKVVNAALKETSRGN